MKRRELLRAGVVAAGIGTAGCATIGRTATETPDYPNSPEGVVKRYYTEREREEIIEYIHSDSEFKEVRSEYAEGRGQYRGPREIQEIELQNKTSDRAVVRVTYDHAGPCEEKRWDACTTSTFRATLRTNETGAWKIWSENSLG